SQQSPCNPSKRGDGRTSATGGDRSELSSERSRSGLARTANDVPGHFARAWLWANPVRCGKPIFCPINGWHRRGGICPRIQRDFVSEIARSRSDGGASRWAI